MEMPSLLERSFSPPFKHSQIISWNPPSTPSPSSSPMNSSRGVWLVSTSRPPITQCYQLQELIVDATSQEVSPPSNPADWLTQHMWSLQINAINQEKSYFQSTTFLTQRKALPHPSQSLRNMMGSSWIYQMTISRIPSKYTANLSLF